MELRRELLLTVGALVVLNMMLAFGAIALFVRMGPAIERIMEDNVTTIVASEDLLAALATTPPGPVPQQTGDVVREALDRMQQNVHEPMEENALVAIEQELAATLDGDTHARERLVQGTRELIRINREAMQRVDDEAKRLGTAGAWSAVFVGFVSFLLSLLLLVRLQNRLVQPLLDLFQVLQAARRGNRMRRCRSATAPREVQQVIQSVNGLLDERLHGHEA